MFKLYRLPVAGVHYRPARLATVRIFSACCDGIQNLEPVIPPTPGTVKEHYHHIFVKVPRPSDAPPGVVAWWPSLAERHPALLQVFKSLAENKSGVAVKVTAYDNATIAPTTTSNNKEGEGDYYDLMVFPSGVLYTKLSLSVIGQAAVHGISPTAAAPPALTNSSQKKDVTRNLMLFVCCHGERDARCGVLGPPLAAELQRLAQARGLSDLVRVFQTSHIGGHKYAGNIVVHCASHPSDGDWYGGVCSANAGEFLDALLAIDVGADGGAEDENLRRWWRGRMGLTKKEQVALYTCGGGVESAEEDGEEEEVSSEDRESEEGGGVGAGGALSPRQQARLEDEMESEDDECPPMAIPLAKQDDGPITALEQDTHPELDNEIIAPPVPVLLLTGYLGAGKTTLVNYILTAKHGYRCAVLLNEFGDTADVEKALVKEPEGNEASPLTDWVQLENGCICCSVKNDMVKALESLLQQRDKFDYIIIETTGLANPGPVAAALWTDAELESAICLDAIVTVVDAKNVQRHLHEVRTDGVVNEAQQQVAFADVVLLNKVDLVDAEYLEVVERDVKGVNSEAEIIRCERCCVDLGKILHTGICTGAGGGSGGAYYDFNDGDYTQQIEGSFSIQEGEHDHQHEQQQHHQEQEQQLNDTNNHHHHHHHTNDGCETGCSHPEHAHSHDPAVRTVTLRVSHALSMPRVRHWLDELLWERDRGIEGDGNGGGELEDATAPDIFRVKGLLHVQGSTRKYVLQAVHELYDVVEGPEWGPVGEQRSSKVVFIGRHLDGPRLQRELEQCCAAVLP